MTDNELVAKAKEALEYSYSPYSHFAVGAALLSTDGQVFTGCNIENAAYTPSNCAERTAIFKAVSEGITHFKAICIVGGTEGRVTDYAPPCGVCRQVMMEFCNPETFEVILAINQEKYQTFRLKELYPMGFQLSHLQNERR